MVSAHMSILGRIRIFFEFSGFKLDVERIFHGNVCGFWCKLIFFIATPVLTKHTILF
jgi:hypothetical protein